MENNEDKDIILNVAEHTSYIKYSPKELMRQYSQGDIIMVLPQPVSIVWAGYFAKYDTLKEVADVADKSICSYMELRSEMVPITDFKFDLGKKTNRNLVQMFNEYDSYDPVKRDIECQLITFDMQTPQEYQFDNNEVMERLFGAGSNDGLKIMIRTYPGDFSHPNE